MNLSIRKEKNEGVIVLYLSGEIDAFTATKLREELIPLAELAKTVKVDLSDVDYIDSTGLGVFIGALKATHVNEGSLTLVGMSQRIQRLFSITGLDEVIAIEEGEGQK